MNNEFSQANTENTADTVGGLSIVISVVTTVVAMKIGTPANDNTPTNWPWLPPACAAALSRAA